MIGNEGMFSLFLTCESSDSSGFNLLIPNPLIEKNTIFIY